MKDLSQTEMATSKKTKSLFAFYWNFLRRVMPHSTPESRYSIIIVTKLLNVFFNKIFQSRSWRFLRFRLATGRPTYKHCHRIRGKIDIIYKSWFIPLLIIYLKIFLNIYYILSFRISSDSRQRHFGDCTEASRQNVRAGKCARMTSNRWPGCRCRW